MMWIYNGKELSDDEIPPNGDKMSDWIFDGNPITSLDDIPKDKKYIGFIYLITQKSTGKFYIGRKLLTRAATKSVKGIKKKIRKESDWKDYWSSSPTILELIKETGTDDFTREILSFVSSKGSLAYSEEMALYMVGALESPNWINENIRSKIYKSWCKPTEAQQLRESIRRLSLAA